MSEPQCPNCPHPPEAHTRKRGGAVKCSGKLPVDDNTPAWVASKPCPCGEQEGE